VARVDGVDVERRSRVDDAVDEQDAAAGRAVAAVVRVVVAEPADDDRRDRSAAAPAAAPATTTTAASATTAASTPGDRRRRRRACRAASRGHLVQPLEAEILHGVLVDQLQRAVAFAAEITRVAGPLVRQRLHDRRRIEAAG